MRHFAACILKANVFVQEAQYFRICFSRTKSEDFNFLIFLSEFEV